MWFSVITIFPEMFQALQAGLVGKAIQKQQIHLTLTNPRDFATDKHQTVDDKPYGGGPGMIMRPDPLAKALQACKDQTPLAPKVIYLSPQGKLFNQHRAERLAEEGSVILLAGRYEGIDQRIIDLYVDEEWTIGDYILMGGELAIMVVIETTTRLLPNVLGNEASIREDSISSGLIKFPQYTRPETFQNLPVPSVLLSGDHRSVAAWRLKQSLGQTWLKRPDLLKNNMLSQEAQALLQEFIEDQDEK